VQNGFAKKRDFFHRCTGIYPLYNNPLENIDFLQSQLTHIPSPMGVIIASSGNEVSTFVRQEIVGSNWQNSRRNYKHFLMTGSMNSPQGKQAVLEARNLPRVRSRLSWRRCQADKEK
jgi:hypothetical protein